MLYLLGTIQFRHAFVQALGILQAKGYDVSFPRPSRCRREKSWDVPPPVCTPTKRVAIKKVTPLFVSSPTVAFIWKVP
jgi:hypothetical protein